jgi:hypothetical protein
MAIKYIYVIDVVDAIGNILQFTDIFTRESRCAIYRSICEMDSVVAKTFLYVPELRSPLR